MVESRSLQAVIHARLAGYAEHHPLSPREWQVCHHILDCRTDSVAEYLGRHSHRIALSDRRLVDFDGVSRPRLQGLSRR